MTKRILLLCVLGAAALLASDTPVLIQDTLRLQSPNNWNGVITISAPAFTAAGGTVVAKGSRDYTVIDGAVAISLYATSGASPSFLYTVRYRSTDAASRGLTWTETWYVPSSGPVTLDDVRRSSSVGIGVTYRGHYAGRPTAPHTLDMVLFDDADSGTPCGAGGGTGYALCVWTGTEWTALTGTATTTTPHWTTLTNAQWTAMTNAQWTALAN